MSLLQSRTKPESRRERRKSYRRRASLGLDPDLTGGARRKAIRIEARNLEISELPEQPIKLPMWRRPEMLVRAVIAGVILSPFAWGLYDYGLESRLPLLLIGGIIAGVGVLAFAAATAMVTRVSKGHGRFVAPAFLLSLVVMVIGAWLIYQHQLHPGFTNTDLWHYFVTDPLKRHGYRKCFEGIVIVIGGLSYAFNPYSVRHLLSVARGPSPWDEVEIHTRVPNFHDDNFRNRHHLPQISGWQVGATFGFWQFAYSFWGVVLLLNLAAGLLHYTVPQVGPTWAHMLEDPATGSVIYLVVGLLVGPLAKRPVAPVLDELEKWRAEAFVLRGSTIRWYHHIWMSYYYIERIRRTNARNIEDVRTSNIARSRWFKVAIVAGILIFLAIWGRGVYQMLSYYGLI